MTRTVLMMCVHQVFLNMHEPSALELDIGTQTIH